MMVWHKSSPLRFFLACAFPVSLMAGCGDGAGEIQKQPAAVSAAKKSDADTESVDAAVMQQIAEENAPRVVSFPDPGKAEANAYLDARMPMTAFNLYNAKRDWIEAPDDIADSIADASNVRKANPELYRLASGRLSEKDSFKRKDLTKAIGALVAEEAENAKANNLVKLSSDEWLPISLSGYDDQAKGFHIDNCLFSDKLEYTDEEQRSQSRMAENPLRCYLNPGPIPYYIGFQGGSNVCVRASRLA
ncbi:hypothetical protein [Pseudomonas sp. HLT2-19-2]